jgi:hypothetical protein
MVLSPFTNYGAERGPLSKFAPMAVFVDFRVKHVVEIVGMLPYLQCATTSKKMSPLPPHFNHQPTLAAVFIIA